MKASLVRSGARVIRLPNQDVAVVAAGEEAVFEPGLACEVLHHEEADDDEHKRHGKGCEASGLTVSLGLFAVVLDERSRHDGTLGVVSVA